MTLEREEKDLWKFKEEIVWWAVSFDYYIDNRGGHRYGNMSIYPKIVEVGTGMNGHPCPFSYWQIWDFYLSNVRDEEWTWVSRIWLHSNKLFSLQGHTSFVRY